MTNEQHSLRGTFLMNWIIFPFRNNEATSLEKTSEKLTFAELYASIDI